ncbi:MAG: protease inhibitor I42 family protein [Chloroflexota bacterium]
MKTLLMAAAGLLLMVGIGGGTTACVGESGNASQGSGQASVGVSCDDFAKSNRISEKQEVPVGSSLTVSLCSNPTTGFRWEAAEVSDETVLQQTDHNMVMATPEPPPPPGTAGKEVWTFKALKTGTSTISIRYSRPWEGGEKGVWIFNLDVVVK